MAKNVRCARCEEEGKVRGCLFCAELNGESPIGSKDDAGNFIPVRLLEVFMDAKMYKAAENLLDKLAKTCQSIDNGPTKAGHLGANAKYGYHRFYVPLRAFRWRMRMLRPSLVCVPCEGIGCDLCGSKGWLTVEESSKKEIPQ